MNVPISIKNVSKKFGGIRAVNKLSFDVQAHIITGIVGPNGSGKTTLINILTGVFPLDSGEVRINGVLRPHHAPAYSNRDFSIARTFQDIRLFNHMPVYDNIALSVTNRTVIGAISDFGSASQVVLAEHVLRDIGMWDKRSQLANELSYGQRKLLEIGRAVATGADILIFDEPFAGLYPEMVRHISSILSHLKSVGKTIILVEHDMALVRALCDDVVVLQSGELLARGAPDDVLSDPVVIEAYLGT